MKIGIGVTLTIALIGLLLAGVLFVRNTQLQKDLVFYQGARSSDIQRYLKVLEAFQDWEYGPSALHVLDRNTARIDASIAALNDQEVSDLWSAVKANFARGKETGVFGYDQVIVLITARIRDLLP